MKQKSKQKAFLWFQEIDILNKQMGKEEKEGTLWRKNHRATSALKPMVLYFVVKLEVGSLGQNPLVFFFLFCFV